jgi:hypothetical protein
MAAENTPNCGTGVVKPVINATTTSVRTSAGAYTTPYVPTRPSYLEIKNYLHNELGINRELVTEIIREAVRNYIDDGGLNRMIEQAVGQEIRMVFSPYSSPTSSQAYFKAKINEEIQKQAAKLVIDRMNIHVSIKEEE